MTVISEVGVILWHIFVWQSLGAFAALTSIDHGSCSCGNNATKCESTR